MHWPALLLVLSVSATANTVSLSNSPRFPHGLRSHLSAPPVSPIYSDTTQLRFGTKERFPAYTFQQKSSHLDDGDDSTFSQRYWFDDTFYKPGGPVFLLDGGETDGSGRIPFLESGILRILSEATGGIGLILEHRFYGESFPVTNLSTDSMATLTTLQSLKDSANLASNLVFPGRLSKLNLTASNTAWIYYGGSYAGAKAAFARKLFPDVFWGAIASSGVTTAIVDFWQYYEPIRRSASTKCIEPLIAHTATIDSILKLHNTFLTPSLKDFFGLRNVTSDVDFVNALAIPLGSWQGRNWDEEVGSAMFDGYCEALAKDRGNLDSEDGAGMDEGIDGDAAIWSSVFPGDPRNRMVEYARYITQNVASLCPEGMAQDDCFGSEVSGEVGLEQASWRSWTWQFCTEWGYFIGSAPYGVPSLVSRLIGTEYTAQQCRAAFPPGNTTSIPAIPNVDLINQYGSHDLEYPRLAFIDGSADPWLGATPHSPLAPNPRRKDTVDAPFILINGGVHHWDENGRVGNEPREIRKVHEEEIEFVRAWMKTWRERGRWKIGRGKQD